MNRFTSKNKYGDDIITAVHCDWTYDPKEEILVVVGDVADKLAAYENTGLTPEEIIAMKERLVVDPSGTDKIDELEEAIDFVRLECENLKMENKRLREFIGKTEGNKDER